MGLRVKLGLYVVIFVGVVLSVTGYFSITFERQIFSQEMENRGITLLRAFAIPCTIAMANNDISTLDNYVVQFSETAQSMDLRYMAVLDFSGRVIAHTSPGEFGKTYTDSFTLQAMESVQPVARVVKPDRQAPPIMEVAVPVISGLRWGTIQAGFTLANVERAMARSGQRLLITGLLISLGAAAIAFFGLSWMVVRPVLKMRQMTQRFGSGDMRARVRLRQQDEIGQLGLAMNRMAQEIQDYTVSLEQKVAERTAELAETNKQLDKLARTDGLTGLYNRRHFMEQLDFEIRRGLRTKSQFTLIMMDVDHFKTYNDTNGHTAGDELLQRLAALLQINLRQTDMVARYGGEEFIILLLDTRPEEGVATARKLQQVVAAQSMPHAESQPGGKITVSVGVAFFPSDSEDAHSLIEHADQALYQSKADGRNRVTSFRDLHKKVANQREG